MSKQEAWIFDIDGTLFNPAHRMHLLDVDKTDTQNESIDWPRFNSLHVGDSPYLDTHKLLVRLRTMGDVIIFMTARQDQNQETTLQQLIDYGLYEEHNCILLMRKGDDFRSDLEVKRDLYFDSVDKHFEVLGVIEDREKVVEMWRTVGLTCYQPRPSPY